MLDATATVKFMHEDSYMMEERSKNMFLVIDIACNAKNKQKKQLLCKTCIKKAPIEPGDH